MLDKNRPVLTVNKVPQFIRQVTGDIRQLRPSIHVVPIDEKADEMVSTDVLPEMVRYIERRSDAKASYFSAADQMVAAGIGHCRVFTEYAAATTANQEIGITLIQDGIAVVWDPDSIHPTRKDANYCFVPVDLNRKAAEARWKGRKFDTPLAAPFDPAHTWVGLLLVGMCAAQYFTTFETDRGLAQGAEGARAGGLSQRSDC